MEIALINPALSGKEQAGNLESVENVMRALGIGYIAAVLEKNNFKVEIKAPTFYDMIIKNEKEVYMKFLLDL